MTSRRNFTTCLAGATALGGLGFPFQASSQSWLDTTKILVGFPPGGTTDALSRRIADKLRRGYPDMLASLLKADAEEWRRLIKTVGFTAES